MIVFQSLVIFDFSVMLLMVILAYLSRRLGEALKIPHYYKLLFFTALLIFISFLIDTVPAARARTFSMGMRCAASAIAFLICLRYWRWLFDEYLKP